MAKPYRGDLSIVERLAQNGPLPSLNRIAQDRRDALAEIERLRADIEMRVAHAVRLHATIRHAIDIAWGTALEDGSILSTRRHDQIVDEALRRANQQTAKTEK